MIATAVVEYIKNELKNKNYSVYVEETTQGISVKIQQDVSNFEFFSTSISDTRIMWTTIAKRFNIRLPSKEKDSVTPILELLKNTINKKELNNLALELLIYSTDVISANGVDRYIDEHGQRRTLTRYGLQK